MKLISCYITGFGKFENKSFAFREGLNPYLEDNGWGKTTFCAFIKAMFYGMEYKTHVKYLTERKHYKPWNASAYGGSLTFEVNDKVYRVERTFGAKDKEDTFLLIDEATGKESTDYSERLGEELFEVDMESFEKSIFLPQDRLLPTMTNSLNAKMGDLAEAKNDINNFDNAIYRISEQKKLYSQTGKQNPGQLKQIEDEIFACQELLDSLPAQLEAYEKQEQLIAEKKESRQRIIEERQQIADQIADISRREQQLGEFKAKSEQLERAEAEMSSLGEFFANGTPTPEQIALIREKETTLLSLDGKLEALTNALPDDQTAEHLNALFLGYELNPDEVAEWDETANRLARLRAKGEHNRMSDEDRDRLDKLKSYFSAKLPTEEELSEMDRLSNELVRLDGEISARENRYFTLKGEKEAAEKKKKDDHGRFHPAYLLLVIAALCGFGAYWFYFRESDEMSFVYAIILAGAAAVCVLATIFTLTRSKAKSSARLEGYGSSIDEAERELADSRKKRENIFNRCRAYLSPFLVTPTESVRDMVREIRENLLMYQHLLEEEKNYNEANSDSLEELSEKQLTLYTALAHYAMVEKINLYESGGEQELIRQLKSDYPIYEAYCENRRRLQNLLEEKNALAGDVEAFLALYPTVEGETNQLNAIEHMFRSYLRAEEAAEGLRQELESMRDYAEIPEDMPSVEDLQEWQLDREQEYNELSRQLLRDYDELSRMSEEIEYCDEARERLDHLKEEQIKVQEKIAILDDTIHYLQEAKEQFLAKYMGPLRKGMRKYLAMIFGESMGEQLSKNFTLDMDLNVSYVHQGSTKERDYFSTGFKDLVSFCSRMALIDILYTAEKPILILDDPFSELDKDKVGEALEILQGLAGERQVLYFTCHGSRMPQS